MLINITCKPCLIWVAGHGTTTNSNASTDLRPNVGEIDPLLAQQITAALTIGLRK